MHPIGLKRLAKSISIFLFRLRSRPRTNGTVEQRNDPWLARTGGTIGENRTTGTAGSGEVL